MANEKTKKQKAITAWHSWRTSSRISVIGQMGAGKRVQQGIKIGKFTLCALLSWKESQETLRLEKSMDSVR